MQNVLPLQKSKVYFIADSMARLQLILATENPAAMLIKYGPGRCSCTVGWDRRTDEIKLGQCLKQRLECPDLSPEGQYFSYYVDTHNPELEHSIYRVISRAPWLKAEAFWSSSDWAFGPGAALFFGAGERPKIYALRADCKPAWDHLHVMMVSRMPEEWLGFKKDSISFLRWQRDGWSPVTSWDICPPGLSAGIARWKSSDMRVHRIVFEKRLPYGWKLQLSHWCGLNRDVDRGVSFETYALVSPEGSTQLQANWTSADFDAPRKRVVWTMDNMLFAAAVKSNGLNNEIMLWDARELKFTPSKPRIDGSFLRDSAKTYARHGEAGEDLSGATT